MSEETASAGDFYNQRGIARSLPHFDEKTWEDLERKFASARKTGDAVEASRLLQIARIVRREQSLIRTLGELTRDGKDLSGFEVAKCFYLELDTGNRQFLPAVVARTGLLVASQHERTIKFVGEMLPKQPHHIRCQTFLAKRGESYGFRVQSDRFFEEPRAEIVDADDITTMMNLFDRPLFVWSRSTS